MISKRTRKINLEIYQRNLTEIKIIKKSNRNFGTEKYFAKLKNPLEALNNRMDKAEENQ